MTSISIIGRGTMGQAIQSVFERAGASVQLVGRDDAATGDVVVLAVPYAALADIARPSWRARSWSTSRTRSTSRRSTP